MDTDTPSVPLAETLAASALAKGIELVVEDIYTSAKDTIKTRFERWKTTRRVKTLCTKLRAVRNVKTVWQVEREIDLAEFYHPSRVKFAGRRFVVHELADFKFQGNIVVEGTVGQGKSIFLRYLTSREMINGKVIPLFVELRRLTGGMTLWDLLCRELVALGLPGDKETVEYLCEEGKLSLFLDALDEVPDAARAVVIGEMEWLSRRFERLRLLISSRPNTGISGSPHFRVAELTPLVDGEYQQVVRNMVRDASLSAQIVARVEGESRGIRHLLTTPLMVALLVVRYRVEQTVPDTLAAFYGDLFILLLQRHDKSKGGYVRPRKSGISDGGLQDTFDAFCFLVRREDAGAFSPAQARAFAADALRRSGYTADPGSFVQDISQITCLLLEDGGECRFLHKSVAEYHAASFVRRLPEAVAAKFYQAARSRFGHWHQEIRFLSVIDEYKFIRFFALPDTDAFMAACGLSCDGPVDGKRALGIFASIRFRVTLGRSAQAEFVMSPEGASWYLSENWTMLSVLGRMFGVPLTPVANEIEAGRVDRVTRGFDGDHAWAEVTLGGLQENKVCRRFLRDAEESATMWVTGWRQRRALWVDRLDTYDGAAALMEI